MTQTATLAEMVDDLKAEVGFSLLPSHGQSMEQTMRYMLKRKQKELYEARDWLVLMDYEDSEIKQGETVTQPFTKLNVERINKLWVQSGLVFELMTYGIDPEFTLVYREGIPCFYRYKPVDTSENDSTPPQYFDVWPAAAYDYKVRAQGTLALRPLVDDGDRSTLDAQAIILFAAAEILMRNKAPDAAMKLQMAQEYLRSILKQQGPQKREPTSMAPAQGGRRPIPGLDFIPAGYRHKT